MVFRYLDKFQFVEQNSVECPCDLGANLVQHFMRRYSRYSRYRTKSHDKATISHDITRYSRYRTAFLKLQEIISTKGRNLQKMLRFGGAFFVISWRTVMIALRQVISLDWLRQVMMPFGQFEITRAIIP